jgi:hypothetical protein
VAALDRDKLTGSDRLYCDQTATLDRTCHALARPGRDVAGDEHNPQSFIGCAVGGASVVSTAVGGDRVDNDAAVLRGCLYNRSACQ